MMARNAAVATVRLPGLFAEPRDLIVELAEGGDKTPALISASKPRPERQGVSCGEYLATPDALVSAVPEARPVLCGSSGSTSMAEGCATRMRVLTSAAVPR